MKKIITSYGNFLRNTSTLYRSAAEKNNANCKRGCFECCSAGFFDITLLDALHLRAAMRQVPDPLRSRILARAEEQLDVLEKKKAFSRRNPLLRTEKDIDRVSLRSARVSCPALENGGCTIYEHRPHICRIFGPTIRGARRAVHLEGCGYFKKDIPAADFPVLDNYADEEVLLRKMFRKAGRVRLIDLDTIIPAALTMDLSKWLFSTNGARNGHVKK
ncbi:MAG: hypothetical protein A2X56_01480 [Nitrospirae bacterium GWC2_57_13]|jgi:Fe-S-cluster containining protein|nr:MAG: hypothetical protein A2072_03115 [Nitrospirae bacterium GWC1_57_7]OGW27087.1 MAG: hypothetical protein A2X56_01480 [Nitrospirae bacterium GWC2_57_13]OGW45645.1 MAG: hypothetical protein A2X57_03200 [Nitrospirae bacterium GWD2_57_8]HAR45749.1 hypothetical protein [Nitrospiraceae bacterium]